MGTVQRVAACPGLGRQQRHLAGVLDRLGDLALLLDCQAGHSPGANLASVRDEHPQCCGVFVIDALDAEAIEQVFFAFVGPFRADLAAIYQLAFRTPGRCPSWASWRTRTRESPNLRRCPRGRPSMASRLRNRTGLASRGWRARARWAVLRCSGALDGDRMMSLSAVRRDA